MLLRPGGSGSVSPGAPGLAGRCPAGLIAALIAGSGPVRGGRPTKTGDPPPRAADAGPGQPSSAGTTSPATHLPHSLPTNRSGHSAKSEIRIISKIFAVRSTALGSALARR
ncbi:hypothetical protein FMEAI12_4500013 [Parafrankia sp. Ea1.12]|nr:hypothetical protein FMEAI12_4500013 [Parafrankia sp. Ea1.12]